LKLTIKQKRFADEYIISGNATEAARIAGYKHPNKVGSENLVKLGIKKYIEERLEELESTKIADQKEVLEYLTRVMRREESEHTVVTITTEVSEYVPDERGTMRKKTVKTEEPQVVEMPAKLSDTNKAAELLGKRHGTWTEKIDMTADLNINVVMDYGSDSTE
jgi:phage terminase small subunit